MIKHNFVIGKLGMSRTYKDYLAALLEKETERPFTIAGTMGKGAFDTHNGSFQKGIVTK